MTMKSVSPKILYLTSLFLWLLFVAVLAPKWRGQGYLEQDPGAENLVKWGTFGLNRNVAPIWNPPNAFSDTIHGTVRWPWQEPSRQYHVELSLTSLALRIALGLVVLGISLRVYFFLTRKAPDRFAVVAWCFSLGLSIALVIVFVFAAVGMGYGLTDERVIAILSGGGVVGLIYGFFGCALFGVAAESGAAKAAHVGTGLLWVLAALITAIFVAFVAEMLIKPLRGPVIGVSVLGTPRFEQPQNPYDVVVGAVILLSGWLWGYVVLRKWKKWTYAIAVIVFATIIGLGAILAP